MWTRTSNGTIIPKEGLPAEPKPLNIQGSAITAAGERIAQNTTVQAGAIKTLGSSMSGGATIELKNVPASAPVPPGGTDPKQLYANMLSLKAGAGEASKFDSLGSAPSRPVGPVGPVGGRKRTKRKGNARRSRVNTRKNRRVTKRTRRVRHSRRRILRFH